MTPHPPSLGSINAAGPAGPSSRPSERPLMRAAMAVLLLAASAALALAAAPTADTIKAYLGRGEYTQAITAARELVATSPNDADAHVLLGTALFARARDAAKKPNGTPGTISMADAQPVAKELEAAIKIAPDRKDLYFGLLDLWDGAGGGEPELKEMQRTAQKFPGDRQVMTSLLHFATDAMKRGDPATAKMFAAIQEAFPKQPNPVLARASYLVSVGNLDETIRVLEEANLAMLDVDLLEALGDAYCYRLEFDAALKLYAKGAATDTKRESVRFKWAVLLQRTDPKSALVIAEPLRGAERGGPPTIALNKNGTPEPPNRVARAAVSLVKALNSPDFTATEAYTLGKGFWQASLAAPAVVETDIALAKDPMQIEALMLRSDIYERTGLDPQCLTTLDRALALYNTPGGKPSTYSKDEIIVARAAALTRLGKNSEALDAYKSLDNASLYNYQMAVLNQRLGHSAEARALFQKVAATGTDPSQVQAAKDQLAQEAPRTKP